MGRERRAGQQGPALQARGGVPGNDLDGPALWSDPICEPLHGSPASSISSDLFDQSLQEVDEVSPHPSISPARRSGSFVPPPACRRAMRSCRS